jgi:hypothetical protein
MSNLENIVEPVETLAESSLEAPKVKKPRGRPKALVVDTDLPVEPVEESPPKVKRQQTDKQRANFIKALEVRKQRIEERKLAKLAAEEAKEHEQEVKKKIIETKVLKKAKCLKKRELLEQTALDDLPSDEDIPDSIIEKVIKKQRAKAKAKVVAPVVAPVEQSVQKYNFV